MKMKKISEGAESYIYSGKFLGIEGILKRRIVKKYRLKEIDEGLRSQRTRSEARILCLASELGISSPRVFLVDKYDIYMTRIDGIMLSDLLDSGEKRKMNGLFETIGSYCALLHNSNIAHGDYTPANIMVKGNAAYVIDFGLSEITNSIEQKALDLLLMKRSITAKQNALFISSYKKACKEDKHILQRLNEIEKRGRYNTRTLAAL